jgi:alpha-glucosidase
VWLSPFYLSPQVDAEYDVADYRGVEPVFGTLADADALIREAHELDIRVIIDLVPRWPRRRGSRERARYLFRARSGPDGSQPPNNLMSNFSGRAAHPTCYWPAVPDGAP